MTSEEFLDTLKSEKSRRVIIEMIIADIRANGPIRMALLGIFPKAEEEGVCESESDSQSNA